MNPMNRVGHVRIGSPTLSGLLTAFVVMGIATVLASLVLIATDQSEEVLPSYAYGIHALAALAGSFVSGKKAGRKGWIFGGTAGLLYSLIVVIVGFLSFDRGLDLTLLAFIGGAFLAGAVGGILGVNARK